MTLEERIATLGGYLPLEVPESSDGGGYSSLSTATMYNVVQVYTGLTDPDVPDSGIPFRPPRRSPMYSHLRRYP